MRTNSMRILGSYSEIQDELAVAENTKKQILQELKAFVNGDIDINLYIKRFPMGHSSAADLTVNGEVCRTYIPADLCFLELNELMLSLMIKERSKIDDHKRRLD